MGFVRHAAAIVILPVTVTIIVPRWICRRYHVPIRLPAMLSEWLAVLFGTLLFLAGLALFITALSLFARRGKGTLAPWDPPRHLVVEGPYRFVRNPMISGVILILAAEALVLRSVALAAWAAVFFLINAVYIPLLEEPQLQRRFGEEYSRYRQNVPRMVPRLRPWRG